MSFVEVVVYGRYLDARCEADPVLELYSAGSGEYGRMIDEYILSERDPVAEITDKGS